MSTPAGDADGEEVLAMFRAQLEAMARGDTAALDRMFAADATLTHITGYVQPKDEWLAEMREHLVRCRRRAGRAGRRGRPG